MVVGDFHQAWLLLLRTSLRRRPSSLGQYWQKTFVDVFDTYANISRASFTFICGISLTHPVLASFLSGEFLLHIPCCLHFYLGSFSYTSHAAFSFLLGVSLTHPMLSSFLKSTEFLWHIPFWLHFYLRSFSYISSAGLIFMWGVSLTHPMLTLFSLSRAGFVFYRGSFSYTPHANFVFSITCWLRFLSGEFLLHTPG